MSEGKKRTLVSFDWAMKSILKRPENFEVLEGFLAALLNDEDIKILEILESESTQRDELDKFNRVDLKAKDSSGKIIIIELQYESEADYLARIYYGTSKIVSEYMRRSYAYGEMPRVISVSIVYFDFMRDCYAAKSEMRFKDMNSERYLSGIKDDIFAEYYLIQPKWFDDNVKTSLDEWVYMLKYSDIKEGSSAKNIEKAKDALDFAKMTPQEQSDFDYYWNISKRSAINVKKAALEEGRAEGMAIGKEEGMAVGREEGREEGALNKAVETAVKMLARGKPVDEIIEFTGLTKEKIEEIERI